MDALPMAPAVRVLLVEDSEMLTERLTEAIEQIADVHLIGTAETEAAALALVTREPVDVIILDLHLRQGTGFGVMRHCARNRGPSTAARPQRDSGGSKDSAASETSHFH
jgi:response regulator of citrate/malate metabolism